MMSNSTFWTQSHTGLKQFRRGSKLYHFLVSRRSDLVDYSKDTYRAGTIYLAIKEIIQEDGLFDRNNPQIVVCDSELEEALGVSAFHVSQGRRLINRHFVNNPGFESWPSPQACYKETDAALFWITHEMLVPNENARPVRVPRGFYKISPELHYVFKTHLGEKRTILAPPEVSKLAGIYITMFKDKFLDPRNPFVAKIKDDPLSLAFKVDYFSRNQLGTFLAKQLIPLRRSPRFVEKGTQTIN